LCGKDCSKGERGEPLPARILINEGVVTRVQQNQLPWRRIDVKKKKAKPSWNGRSCRRRRPVKEKTVEGKPGSRLGEKNHHARRRCRLDTKTVDARERPLTRGLRAKGDQRREMHVKCREGKENQEESQTRRDESRLWIG